LSVSRALVAAVSPSLRERSAESRATARGLRSSRPGQAGLRRPCFLPRRCRDG